MRFLHRVAGVPLFDSTTESRGANGGDWGTLSGKSQVFFLNSLITMILKVNFGTEEGRHKAIQKKLKVVLRSKDALT